MPTISKHPGHSQPTELLEIAGGEVAVQSLACSDTVLTQACDLDHAGVDRRCRLRGIGAVGVQQILCLRRGVLD
ncbi:hypothetical protein AB0L13_33165 [Saccharopolyspora shandongensis]|uniref:hypothetical protein n=1 Tax=Saccharopolyspora shandongensis TaxID=418495 RepID=UPI003449A27E